jgi:putative transposase
VPQSLAVILVHLVFSTKCRDPAIVPEVRQDLHKYLGGTLGNMGCPPMQVGGTDDHVHLLFRLSRTLTMAEVVEKVKSSSSKWMGPTFAWQSGYGAFSVSASDATGVVAYIQNQEEHHRRVTFQDEFRALLAEAGMEFDERYVWD